MLTFDQMIAPSLRRREVTIQGLAGSPTLTFDPANATNPRWLEWVLAHEEQVATDAEPKLEPGTGIAALRAGRQQVLDLAEMVNTACLVGMVADDGDGARIAYPIEVARKLVAHLATSAPTAFFKLFEALREGDADPGISVLAESVAGEVNGG